jgi:hypothetical protein
MPLVGPPSAEPPLAGYDTPVGDAMPGHHAPAWSGLAGTPETGSAPTTTGPPLWPPVTGDSFDASGDGDRALDNVPALPVNLSASLDMTAELPKMRPERRPGNVGGFTDSSGFTDVSSGSSRYADDLTMELPIFRELESAWFRAAQPSTAEPSPAAGTGPGTKAGWSSTEWTSTTPAQAGGGSDSWPQDAADDSAMVGSRTPAGASYRYGGSRGPDGTGSSGEGVSWRSVADEGWLAAQAAESPSDGGITDIGLPRRVPMAQLVPGGVDTAAGGSERRTPEAVRGLLSAYHRGVQRGRDAYSTADPASPDQHTTGKEQEA